MNIEQHSIKFDNWLGNWMYRDLHRPNPSWSPTQVDRQARWVLEEFIKRNPEWWVEMAYDAQSDFPWLVWLRPLDGVEKEYAPLSSGYSLPLMICKVVALAVTNGDIVDDDLY